MVKLGWVVPDESHEIVTSIQVRDGDVVLVRDGYLPVVAGQGYNVYFLNCLAGSARQLATPRIQITFGCVRCGIKSTRES